MGPLFISAPAHFSPFNPATGHPYIFVRVSCLILRARPIGLYARRSHAA